MPQVPFSEVFILGIHLCLRTGGRCSKSVRVGYKASLWTDIKDKYNHWKVVMLGSK